MFGSLPRLHRWIVVLVCGVAGAALGAWVSNLASVRGGYACGDVLLGICIGTTLNLVPLIAGILLGLVSALILVYDPRDPHRSRRAGVRKDTSET